jgi:hypothetical protein
MLLRRTLKFDLTPTSALFLRAREPGYVVKQMPKQSFARLLAARMEHLAHNCTYVAFHHPFAAPWWLSAGQVNEKRP